MKVVITGASGFLGKALQKMLVMKGDDVYGFTRGSKEGFINVSSYTQLPIIDDAVLVHQAQSRDNSTNYNQSEVDLCGALAARHWCHVVYASSALVYGDRHRHPHMPEEPVTPFNEYTKMKIECEEIFAAAGATCLRISNLYGPGMSDHSVVADILRQLPGEGPMKLKDPKPVRDFLWIKDAAACLAAACSAKVSSTFNSGSGKSITVGDLARMALHIAGEQVRAVATVGESDSSSCLKLDISKTRFMLSWSPETDLRSGLTTLLKAKQCQPVSA